MRGISIRFMFSSATGKTTLTAPFVCSGRRMKPVMLQLAFDAQNLIANQVRMSLDPGNRGCLCRQPATSTGGWQQTLRSSALTHALCPTCLNIQ